MHPHIAMIKSRVSLFLQRPEVSASIRLMRLDKPIGIFLVLWPTLWALWLASEGTPRWQTLFIFVLGGVLMRSAGCVINDYADRNIDGYVTRTQHRPLASGELTPEFALMVFGGLVATAFVLVLLTNLMTIIASVGALVLAASYPFMKRYTHLPQVVLGAAFAWAIPMVFSAVTESLPKSMWTLYIGVLLWTVVYDTFYGMVDREDDKRVGVKSTAVLFADNDRLIISCLQAFMLVVMLTVGTSFKLHWPYYSSLVVTAGLFGYQQFLIKDRIPDKCFEAFLNNNWVGIVIFMGIIMSYALVPATPLAP